MTPARQDVNDCPECGTQLDAAAVICPQCGHRSGEHRSTADSDEAMSPARIERLRARVALGQRLDYETEAMPLYEEVKRLGAEYKRLAEPVWAAERAEEQRAGRDLSAREKGALREQTLALREAHEAAEAKREEWMRASEVFRANSDLVVDRALAEQSCQRPPTGGAPGATPRPLPPSAPARPEAGDADEHRLDPPSGRFQAL